MGCGERGRKGKEGVSQFHGSPKADAVEIGLRLITAHTSTSSAYIPPSSSSAVPHDLMDLWKSAKDAKG